MTFEEIKAEADEFFEFPTASHDHVTTTSAILFARHILQAATEQERERICNWLLTDGLHYGSKKAIAGAIRRLE